jgi:hypothetical protein
MIEHRAKKIIINILNMQLMEMREVLKDCQSDPECPIEVSTDILEGLSEVEYALGELKNE